jgi:hypothetical protein
VFLEEFPDGQDVCVKVLHLQEDLHHNGSLLGLEDFKRIAQLYELDPDILLKLVGFGYVPELPASLFASCVVGDSEDASAFGVCFWTRYC